MGQGGSRRSTSVAANEVDIDTGPRVVLITGCSTGIGLSTAAILAQDDKRFKVYATMRNLEKKSALENLAGKCLGESLFIKALDVLSEESVNSLVKEIESVEGRIDVLGELMVVYCLTWATAWVQFWKELLLLLSKEN